MNKTLTSFLGLIFLSAIWGSSFLFIKLSIDSIPPSFLTFYRLLIASIFLLFFCGKNKINKMIFTNKYLFFGIAIFGNVLPFNLISLSEIYVDSIVASTLIGTMPLFTFLLSFFLFKDQRGGVFGLSGILIGFLGMIIFIGLSKVVIGSLKMNFSFLIVLSAFFYALSATFVKKIENNSPLEIATFSTILATVIAFPVMILDVCFSDYMAFEILKNITLLSLISATVLGVVCTGLAVLVFFYLIKIKNAVFASQSNYLIPCFGSLWAFLFLNEKLSHNMVYGLILIVLGGWMVNSSLKDK